MFFLSEAEDAMADGTNSDYEQKLRDMQALIRKLGTSTRPAVSPERQKEIGRQPIPAAPIPVSPEFPIHIFPPNVAAYVCESALAVRSPQEMVAAPLLAFAGAVIGRQLRLTVAPGWEERPVLWIATIAPTGSGKTPALEAARRPLDILQHRAVAAWENSQTDSDGLRRGQPGSLSRAQPRDVDPLAVPAIEPPALNASRTGGLPVHSVTDPSVAAATEPLALDRLYTTDITTEALAIDLLHSPGLAIVRDELISIIRAMDQYRTRGGDDRQKYLSLWSHQPLAPSRKSSRPIFIQHPVVCIVGGIQPLVVPGLQSRDEDGFIERFLPIVPDTTPAYWPEENEAVAPSAATALDPVVDLFARLRTLSTNPEGLVIPGQLAAFPIWRTWYNRNVDQQQASPTPLHGFYQKLPSHVARFALILHALWNPADPTAVLTEQRVQDAITLGEFFQPQFHRLLPLLSRNSGGAAKTETLPQRILRQLQHSQDPDGWLSRTELLLRIGRGLDAATLTHTLAELIAAQRIELQIVKPPRAGRPSERYRLPRP